jgi:hypothetical protein
VVKITNGEFFEQKKKKGRRYSKIKMGRDGKREDFIKRW